MMTVVRAVPIYVLSTNVGTHATHAVIDIVNSIDDSTFGTLANLAC